MKSPKLRPTLRSLLKPIRPSLDDPTIPGKNDKFYWREASKIPLLEFRTDISKAHGPFRSEDEAVDDAIKNLEQEYADKLSRALGDTTIKIE